MPSGPRAEETFLFLYIFEMSKRMQTSFRKSFLLIWISRSYFCLPANSLKLLRMKTQAKSLNYTVTQTRQKSSTTKLLLGDKEKKHFNKKCNLHSRSSSEAV